MVAEVVERWRDSEAIRSGAEANAGVAAEAEAEADADAETEAEEVADAALG
jgi:hypothetical protein